VRLSEEPGARKPPRPVEGLRARRIRAEQGGLGHRPLRGRNPQKGGGKMAKTVQHESGALTDTALVVLGWLAFLGAAATSGMAPMVSTLLMAVARVLP